MFENATRKEMQWVDNGRVCGLVKINTNFPFQKKLTRPFIRNKGVEVISIGHINYNLLDTFIVNSINDYYNRLSAIKKHAEKDEYIVKYNELYQLWYKVQVAKKEQDIYLNNYYDDVIYYLYLLGYHH